ncbi:hypothetical protein, partial [Parafannyhessea umbonata]|uniref:hypothetical protein n=1 Tax=Parafannyhessea umbonata TaxID=604330 RepID=UPI0026F1DDD8
MVPFPWSVGLLGRFQSYRDGAMPLYAAIRFSKVRKKLYVISNGSARQVTPEWGPLIEKSAVS